MPASAITIPLSAFDPSARRTWAISQPWEKLKAKYFSDGGFLSIEFDLYSARRSATDAGWQNRLEGVDLMATGLMNSRLDSRDVDAVLANRSRIEAALRAVPTDLALVNADLTAEPLASNLKALFAAFRCSRVGVAKVMKTLCQKRPRLLPMLDQYVRLALYNVDSVHLLSNDSDEFAREVLDEVRLFQSVLRWDTNYPRLVELADTLSERIGAEHGRCPDLVTPVRVLDDLLWFEWGGHDNYGWVVNEEESRVERLSGEEGKEKD